jgi:hypothetical protein
MPNVLTTLNKLKKLKFVLDQGNTYCAYVRSGTNTRMYNIAGPKSDVAKLLGGYSNWLLTMPDGTYDVFYRKCDAVDWAEEHFNQDALLAEFEP